MHGPTNPKKKTDSFDIVTK